jgi:hypothetical protein
MVIVTARSGSGDPVHYGRTVPFSITHCQRQVLLGLRNGQTTKELVALLSLQPRAVLLAKEIGIVRARKNSKVVNLFLAPALVKAQLAPRTI